MCVLALSSGTFHILKEMILKELSYPCLFPVLLQAKDCESILISQAALTDSLIPFAIYPAPLILFHRSAPCTHWTAFQRVNRNGERRDAQIIPFYHVLKNYNTSLFKGTYR